MATMFVKSYDKNGNEIKTKDIILKNDNVYKIIKKYVQKPVESKVLVKA